jgi:hypothetical protein
MPSSVGPNIKGEENLVFAIDTHDTSNGITPLGCGGFNQSTQGVKNLLNGNVYQFINDMKLSGRNYFTTFAIDYPENSYGGDAVNRDGITPGYNVRSGTKTFDFSRALNYAVYNNLTNAWVKTTTYDSYVGSAAVDTFVSEYNSTILTYPDATHVIAGSHRDSYHTTAQYNILRDLGAPSNVESIIGFSSPEWILVGKPGLGAGNAFGWVFQNYETNPAQVAHINFGLPVKARGGMEFDGNNDKIDIESSFFTGTENNVTLECIVKLTANQTSKIFISNYTQVSSATGLALGISDSTTNKVKWFTGNLGTTNTLTSNTTLSNGIYYHVVGTYNGSSKVLYINGIQETSTSLTNAINITSAVASVGYLRYLNNQYLNGEIPVAKIYNRALTVQEVIQNYQQYKTRFNLS